MKATGRSLPTILSSNPPEISTHIVELPIRGETEGVCNKGLNLRTRLPLEVPHHQNVVSPLAGRGSRHSCRWRPVNQLGIGCLHAVDSLPDLPLTKMNQLQASDQTFTIASNQIYIASNQIYIASDQIYIASDQIYIASDQTFTIASDLNM